MAKGTIPLSSLPYEAGNGAQKRACCNTALSIPDLIVKEGKKTVINLSVPLLSSLDQGIDHRGIGQGRGITQLINGALGDLAQDPSHDLPAAGLG